MKQTTRCVRCFKKALMWSGHVLRDKQHITAGWCSGQCLQAYGFSGHWTKKMGKTRYVDNDD